jgi:hypothetical protein
VLLWSAAHFWFFSIAAHRADSTYKNEKNDDPHTYENWQDRGSEHMLKCGHDDEDRKGRFKKHTQSTDESSPPLATGHKISFTACFQDILDIFDGSEYWHDEHHK